VRSCLPPTSSKPLLIMWFRKKSIEAKGLSSTGNSQKVAFAAETDAYNTAASKVSRGCL
jgi:hypothetical protein